MLWAWFNSDLIKLSPSLGKPPCGEVSPTPPKESGASRCPAQPFLDLCLIHNLLSALWASACTELSGAGKCLGAWDGVLLSCALAVAGSCLSRWERMGGSWQRTLPHAYGTTTWQRQYLLCHSTFGSVELSSEAGRVTRPTLVAMVIWGLSLLIHFPITDSAAPSPYHGAVSK